MILKDSLIKSCLREADVNRFLCPSCMCMGYMCTCCVMSMPMPMEPKKSAVFRLAPFKNRSLQEPEGTGFLFYFTVILVAKRSQNSFFLCHSKWSNYGICGTTASFFVSAGI